MWSHNGTVGDAMHTHKFHCVSPNIIGTRNNWPVQLIFLSTAENFWYNRSTFVRSPTEIYHVWNAIKCHVRCIHGLASRTALDPAWQHTLLPYLWWLPGIVVSTLVSINEVNQRRAQLVLRWMTVFAFNSRCGTFISLCDQPPRPTQPGHPFVGRRNKYQPKGGDTLRLGSKGGMIHVWVAGKTVWSPPYTQPISERLSNGASP